MRALAAAWIHGRWFCFDSEAEEVVRFFDSAAGCANRYQVSRRFVRESELVVFCTAISIAIMSRIFFVGFLS